MSSVSVIQNGSSRSYELEPGTNILSFLRDRGYSLSAPCGGNGKCGKCSVTIVFGEKTEKLLACSAAIPGDCTLILPDRAESGFISLDTADRSDSLSPGRQGLGAAVDLGTTTIAVKLFDLSDGSLLGTAGEWNRQASYGADVISRTQYTMEHRDGLERLCSIAREQLFSICASLCKEAGYELSALREIYLAGNTVMQHIFAGLSPESLALAPFRPLSLFDDGKALKLNGVELYLAPCMAAYVGGDISSGLYASGLHEKPGLSLFLDVGTNGEMALGGKDGFICCAVASGPAFEGAGISCGMASTEGAINHVSWDRESFQFELIGSGEAKGLCGSALIELLAILVREGLVDESGWLLPPDKAPECFLPWLGEDENGNGILFLSEDDSLYFTASDVRQLQLAKAAVAAGITVLMQSAGVSFEDIDTLYIAGGFGSHMSAESAADIGMLPRALLNRTVCIGNASLAGAQAALLDSSARSQLLEIQRKCKYLELSGNKVFNRFFPEHMSFDEEELEWN